MVAPPRYRLRRLPERDRTKCEKRGSEDMEPPIESAQPLKSVRIDRHTFTFVPAPTFDFTATLPDNEPTPFTLQASTGPNASSGNSENDANSDETARLTNQPLAEESHMDLDECLDYL